MARYVDKSSLARGVPHTPEQLRVCDDFKRIFGWNPESVEFFKGCCGLAGAWSVRVRIGLNRAVQFTFVNGLLLGIFPKTRGQA